MKRLGALFAYLFEKGPRALLWLWIVLALSTAVWGFLAAF